MNLHDKIQEFAGALGGEIETGRAWLRINFREGAYSAFVEYALRDDEIDEMVEPRIRFRVEVGDLAGTNLEQVEHKKAAMLRHCRERLLPFVALLQYVNPEIVGVQVDLDAHDGAVVDLRRFGLPYAIVGTDSGIVAGVDTGAPGAYLVELDEKDFDPETPGSLRGRIWCLKKDA